MIKPDYLILDALPFGVLITDKDLKITAINSWITDQYNVRRDESCGRLIGEIFPEIQTRGFLPMYDLVIESEQKITFSTKIHKYFLQMPGQQDAENKYMPQSAIVSPLFDAGILAGTMTIINDVSERIITEGLLNHEIDKLSIFQKIDQALTTLNLQDCLKMIVDQTKEIFSADGVSIFLMEDNQPKLAAGYGVGNVSSIPEDTLAYWSYQNQKAQYLYNEGNIKSPRPLFDGSRIEIAAPLIVEEKCIGVINASIGQLEKFDRYDLDLFEALAARAAAAIYNARLHSESEYWRNYYYKVNSNLETLLKAVQLINSKNNVKDLLDCGVNLVKEIFGAACVVILRQNSDKTSFIPANSAGASPEHLNFSVFSLKDSQKLYQTTKKSGLFSFPGQVNFFSQALQNTLLLDGLNEMIYSAMETRDNLSGFIFAYFTNETSNPGGEKIKLLEAIGAHLSLALENAELFESQQRLALTDGLTGVCNRRKFDLELEILLKRAKRYNNAVSMIIVDIDNFKHFNDTYGHQLGDEVLYLLANLMLKIARETDIVARYGGEEFSIILPETEISDAVGAAERLRIAATGLLESVSNRDCAKESFSVSIGVSSYPVNALTPEELIKSADSCLYKAKQTGKNRTVSP